MTVETLEQKLKDLVAAVVSTDDPTLMERACAALDMILTEYSYDEGGG